MTLPNHGVLFLDELAEIIAPVLDGLGHPLEEGVARVSRAVGAVEATSTLTASAYCSAEARQEVRDSSAATTTR